MRPFTILVVALAVACARDTGNAGDTAVATAPQTDSATAAATISNAISANPAAADSILRANGHTAESFERLLYDIAADSTLSSRYAAGRTSPQ